MSPWRGRQVFPYIDGCLVAELTAPGFLRVGRRVEERGGGVCAHRVLQNCGQCRLLIHVTTNLLMAGNNWKPVANGCGKVVEESIV